MKKSSRINGLVENETAPAAQSQPRRRAPFCCTALRGLPKDLAKTVRSRRLRKRDLILKRLGRFEDPAKLWRHYIQSTEVEKHFRTLKSELNLPPVWHRIQQRVDAHSLSAFLGYCLWICLERRLKGAATSLTPTQRLHRLKRIVLVEVWFDLRKGGRICLPRITQPEKEQLPILHHLPGLCPATTGPKKS